jgi:hypothetical protein
VGIELAMQVAIEYNREILLLLLLIVYNNLTLTSVDVELAWSITLELGAFGALAFIEEATLGLFKLRRHFLREIQCLLLHSVLSHGGQNMSINFLIFHIWHDSSWALLGHK